MAGAAATIRMMGSGSMDATAIAEGRLHALCQHSVPPWDELPGAAIIRGAGGTTANVRVKRVDSDVQMIRVYGAHERVAVKRA